MRVRGSALFIAIMVLAGINALLMHLHQRSSLLLLTVVDRQRSIQQKYAAEALLLYATHLARRNWKHIHKITSYNATFDWPIDEHAVVPAKISFCSSENKKITIKAELCCKQATMCATCRIERKHGTYAINNWSVFLNIHASHNDKPLF